MKYKKVVQCNICKKIYPRGIPLSCEKCGAEIGKETPYLNIYLTANAKEVIARRRLFGWKIKQEDKQ